MRSNPNIEKSIRVFNADLHPWGGTCDLRLKDGFVCSCIWGRDEGGMEHVSVSSYKKHKTPSWEQMCEVKEIFWDDEEQAVQIHPCASEYVHSVRVGGRTLENVLHLRAPKDGDWSRLAPDRERKMEIVEGMVGDE